MVRGKRIGGKRPAPKRGKVPRPVGGVRPHFPTNRSINAALKYEELGGDLEGKEGSTGRKECGAKRQLVCLEYSDTTEGEQEARENRSWRGRWTSRFDPEGKEAQSRF